MKVNHYIASALDVALSGVESWTWDCRREIVVTLAGGATWQFSGTKKDAEKMTPYTASDMVAAAIAQKQAAKPLDLTPFFTPHTMTGEPQ